MTKTEERPVTEATGVGASPRRVEDARFLTGNAEYLADVRLPGLRHMAILRSPVAHARITRVDVAPALAMPGVRAAFDGAALAESCQRFSHLLPIPTIKPLEWGVLAVDKLRYVGEPVAVVVADSRYEAEDALEAIELDLEELPAVVDADAALADDAPLLYEEWESNDFLFVPFSNGDVEGALASADRVVRERFTHHRIVGLPLEGHGACGQYDRSSGRLVLYASSQQPHNLRTVISTITGLSEAKIRVIAPDMGGGFGNKQHFMREEALVAVVAMQVPYPVAWVQDRSESLSSSVHSREQIHEVEVAVRADGRVLGVRVHLFADLGNPILYFTGAAPALVTAGLLTGAYDIQDYAYELHCVATNKCPIGAYRGFGQPQAFFTIERVMDLVAEELGMDPADVRRLNLIPDEPRPYVSPVGYLYDTGSFGDQLESVIDAIGYSGFRARQERARAEGRYLGVGLASMVEATAPNLHGFAGQFGGFEMAMVSVQPDGKVNVVVGTKSQGQGHETVFAQVASDVLGVALGDIDVRSGDTGVLPYGMGTWGSRSAVMGGGAVIRAAEMVREKMLDIAAHMLQVQRDELTLGGGVFQAGEAVLPVAAVASAAYLHTFLLPAGTDMGLTAVAGFDPGNTSPFPDESGKLNPAATYATAAGAAIVEVDPNTGQVFVEDAVMAHDCGRIINPMIVDGQIQGAFAQAIGAVLLEEIVYGDDGQLLTSTLLDYLIPVFGNVPKLRALHRETPSELPGGFRGAGEGALIVMPAALANAIADAVKPLGVRITQTNLSAPRMRRLLREAGVKIDPVAGVRFGGLNMPATPS